MTEQLKQAIIESGKQYFRSIIIRGVWRVEQKVIGNALRSLFSLCVGHDTNLTGSIPVAGIYRQAKRMASR